MFDGDTKKKVKLILKNQDIAFKRAPVGNIFERWIPGVCRHSEIRCTHGDEIYARRGRRRVCLICGRSLEGDLPLICFFTGEQHFH